MLQALLLSLAVLEASAEGGWGKAKWGMSREEVQKLYPQAIAIPGGLGLRQTEDAGHMTMGPFLEFTEAPDGASAFVSSLPPRFATSRASGSPAWPRTTRSCSTSSTSRWPRTAACPSDSRSPASQATGPAASRSR